MDVVVPVDDPRVDARTSRRSSGARDVVQGEQVVDAVDRLALGVGAVQLDVGERPLGQLALLLDLARPLGLLAPQGQRLQTTARPGSSSFRGPVELALHPAPRRVTPTRAR